MDAAAVGVARFMAASRMGHVRHGGPSVETLESPTGCCEEPMGCGCMAFP